MWFFVPCLGLALAAPNVLPPAAVTVVPITRETLPSLGRKCKAQETINVTDSWILPLTQIDILQYCYYDFNIPPYTYAMVGIVATGMHPDDDIQLGDVFGDFLHIKSQNKQDLLSRSGAWPGNFGVHLLTSVLSELKLSISIVIHPAAPFDNVIQKSQVTKDGPSSLLYINDITAGSSYSYSAQSSQLYMDLSGYARPNSELRNVFIYNNSQLVGTLNSYQFNENAYHNKTFGDLLLYVPVKPQTGGVVLFTDQQNIPKNYITLATINECQNRNTTLYNYSDLTITVISAEDKSSPITVTRISGPGQTSFSFGGPLSNHRNATALSPNLLPNRLAGNIWTFYISDGPGEMDISWSMPTNSC